MKAINMTAWLTALLLAGCSQNEVTETNPDAHPAIGFSVYTGVPTRGQDLTTESLKGDPDDAAVYGGFGIMGYYTGSKTWAIAKGDVAPSFMLNQKVGWNATDSKWTYSPVKYWPNNPDDMISFFAYAPYEPGTSSSAKTGVVTSEITDKSVPFITFSLKPADKLDKMVDLVVASALDQKYTSNTTTNGKINFKFAHTLSRISFRAQLGTGDYDSMNGTDNFVYITHMWIIGTDHSTPAKNLSLLHPSVTDNNNAGSKFYTKATWAELHWNYDAGKAEIAAYDFSLNNLLAYDNGITIDTSTSGSTDPSTGGTVKGVKLYKTAAVNGGLPANTVSLFKDKEYLYLIPVGDTTETVPENDAQGGCADGDIQIGVHYDIVSKSLADPTKYITSHAEAVVKLPAHHLKRAKSYLYTLKINLHTIDVDAEVTPWTDASQDVTIQ